MNRYLLRSGRSPDDAAKGLPSGGALVDASPNMVGLGGYTQGRPSPAMEIADDFLIDRRSGQVSRILDIFDAAVAPVGKDVAEKVAGSPAWKAALDDRIPITADLVRKMSRPSMRDAWKKAQRLASEADESKPIPTFDEFVESLRGIEGRPVEVETGLMHWLKKGMDEVLETKRDPITGKLPSNVPSIRAAQNTRAEFRSIVKKLNPEYGRLLDKASAEFKVDEAYKQGLKALGIQRPSLIAKQMKGMGPRDRRAYQKGVVEDISDRLGKKEEVGFDASGTALGFSKKAKVIFGEKRARSLLSA